MTIAGWIFMLFSWGLIIWLTGFCVYKVIRATKKENIIKENTIKE